MIKYKNARGLKLDKTDLLPLVVWLIVAYFTWLFMHGADHFLALTREALGKYFQLRWFLIAHITGGGGALVLGLLQFWSKLRDFSWKLHRIIGFLYLSAILVSSFCALVLAYTTAGEINWAYAFSLQVWAVVWILATTIAYLAILKKRYGLHKEWMVRSYLVTFAFVVSGLALKTSYVKSLGSFAEVSPSLFWMGWALPLFAYQVFLACRTKH